MDWFERITGFKEATGPAGYGATRAQLEVDGHQLTSRVNGRSYGVGDLEVVSLRDLRRRADGAAQGSGPGRLRIVQGDVGEMHGRPEYCGALFQVASQFNLLEKIGPGVTPEDGVARYEHDRTQGPACAIAAGAATIYRNYFAPVGGAIGQTRDRQIDGFADLARPSRALSARRKPSCGACETATPCSLATDWMRCRATSRRSTRTTGMSFGNGFASVSITTSRSRMSMHCPARGSRRLSVRRSRSATTDKVSERRTGNPTTLVLEAADEATLWAAGAEAGVAGHGPAVDDAGRRRLRQRREAGSAPDATCHHGGWRAAWTSCS